jgi:SAM-dependent methyltransferase
MEGVTNTGSRREALDPGVVARYHRHAAGAMRILDLGCGAGCFGRLKPVATIEVHGVDADPAAVAIASQWEIAVRADLEADPLPYPDGHFQAVFAKDILEHLREPRRVLGEAGRVLQPGGRLVVSVPMAYPHVVWDDYTHVRGFTRLAVRTILEDAGFEVQRIVPMGRVPLAGRLHLVGAIPFLLRIPGMRRLFGRSWEVVALKPT